MSALPGVSPDLVSVARTLIASLLGLRKVEAFLRLLAGALQLEQTRLAGLP